MRFGTTEMIIPLVIVVLLFGVGRIGKIAGEMGKGIREFRSGLTEDKDKDENKEGKETEQTDDKG